MPPHFVVRTRIGWVSFLGEDEEVRALAMGCPTVLAARRALQKFCDSSQDDDLDWSASVEGNWFPELTEDLQRYSEGEIVDFRSYAVRINVPTGFRRKVLLQAQKIPYGETISYGELAARAGSPKASRAVGNAMARNVIPLLIPCHRVVGAAGHLGGFSAPRGTELKSELLDMEADAIIHQTSRAAIPGRSPITV